MVQAKLPQAYCRGIKGYQMPWHYFVYGAGQRIGDARSPRGAWLDALLWLKRNEPDAKTARAKRAIDKLVKRVKGNESQ